jgi:hypothetical protein
VRSLFLDHLSPEEQDVLGAVWTRVLPGVAGAADADDCGC